MEIYGLKIGKREIEKSLMFFMEGFNETIVISYYFWCIKTDNKVILIDTGFLPEVSVERNVRNYKSPDLLLKEIGVEPDEVDIVLLTHLHWDHFGGYSYFPNAKFYVQRTEWEFATGEFSNTKVIKQFYDKHLLQKVEQLIENKQLEIIDNTFNPLSGIQLVSFGGHTPGSQVIMVDTDRHPVIFCGDLGYFYRNFEEENPPMLNLDIPECLAAYRRIKEIVKEKKGTVIPGHDPVILDKFNKISERVIRIK